MRRTKSRFGGRLEPFFRLQMVLYQGRSDLLTVTSAETVDGYPRLREDQLQRFAWKFLIPVALANILATAVLKVVF